MAHSRNRGTRALGRDVGDARAALRDVAADGPSGHIDRGVEGGSRAERKERTRQKLLDVTLRLISERSLSSISLREVARDAGIVPTAFYRHYASMDALGIDLVDDCMRPLRQMTRDARRGRTEHGDIIAETVQVLARQVREHPDQFRFLTRERNGGVESVRRAVATELRLFTSDLTVDLARLTSGLDWTSDDLEMAAALMVAAMLTVVIDLLEADDRHPEDTVALLDRAERQLRLISLGMGSWHSLP